MPKMMMIPLVLLLAASVQGCATRSSGPDEPTVTLVEKGKTRSIPERCFDEQRYLAKGYLKNTNPDGRTIYVFIPATDVPPDGTFMIGDSGGKNRSFGGSHWRDSGHGGGLGLGGGRY